MKKSITQDNYLNTLKHLKTDPLIPSAESVTATTDETQLKDWTIYRRCDRWNFAESNVIQARSQEEAEVIAHEWAAEAVDSWVELHPSQSQP